MSEDTIPVSRLRRLDVTAAISALLSGPDLDLAVDQLKYVVDRQIAVALREGGYLTYRFIQAPEGGAPPERIGQHRLQAWAYTVAPFDQRPIINAERRARADAFREAADMLREHISEYDRGYELILRLEALALAAKQPT